MTKVNKTPLLILVGAGIGLCISCVETTFSLDPDHCNSNGGDEFCRSEHSGGTRPFCVLGTPACSEAAGITDVEHDGCIAARPEDACYSACGEGRSLDDDPDCEPMTADDTTVGDDDDDDDDDDDSNDTTVGDDDDDDDDDTDDDTDGMTTDTTDGGGCVDDEDCTDGGAPFCSDEGECVPCDQMPEPNTACADADPDRPVCSEGTCVQCTPDDAAACNGQTPVCDNDNTCRACDEHFECPDSACHLDGPDVGACFDVADVMTANSAAALASAVSGVNAGDDLVIMLSSGVDYNQTANAAVDAEIALLGPSSAELTGTAGLPSLNVAGTAIVYVAGPSVASGDTGVACSGTSVWLDDTEVRNNAQVGLDISGGCAAHLRRSVVRANSGGGVVVNGASFEARNSAVSNNLGSSPGMQLFNSSIEMSYSTLVGNFASGGTPDTLQCTTPSGFVRNSIISTESASSISGCAALDWDYNALDTSGLGATNDDSIGAWDSGWFAAPDSGDYHLTAAGEMTFMDIAQWQDGDPLADIDGDAISTDMPSFPGYDQP